MAKRGPKQRGETPINAKNTKTFGVIRDSLVAQLLEDMKSVIDRTAMLEKWYQAWKEKGQ